MTTTVQQLIADGDRVFSKRAALLDFWDEVYAHFNPAGGGFRGQNVLNADFADGLMTSYPLLVARDLADQFSTMLRPADRDWAIMEVPGLDDWEGKRWLEWATKVQRRVMYDRASMFVSSAKECDRDFALSGQAVMSIELAPGGQRLLFRDWHLRDVAWTDNVDGSLCSVHRGWSPSAYDLARMFGRSRLHKSVQELLDDPSKDPHSPVRCRHIVMPADLFHGEHEFRTPLVSVYLDVDHQHIIEVTGQRSNSYVIPRWQRVRGTQYAVSPAVVAALPEARLLQAMTATLLEAGEKATNPPMLGVQEAIRADVDIRAGGITWVAAEYDERTGEVLRPLTTDKSGLPIGLEMQQRSEMLLRSAFYIDRLNLPMRTPEMTAYEVAQRVQEYIRNALPLFEPAEIAYNGGVCERTFEVIANAGGFGPPDTWPDSVRGAEIEFKFASPLRDAQDKAKGQVFLEASQVVAQAGALDPGAPALINASEALRDTLAGIGVPTSWTRSREMVAEIQARQAEAAQRDQLLGAMQQAAGVAKDLRAAA